MHNFLRENYDKFCQIQEQVLVLELSLDFSVTRKFCVSDYSEVTERSLFMLTRI